MSGTPPDVVLLRQRIDPAELRRLPERFEGMVKFVVDRWVPVPSPHCFGRRSSSTPMRDVNCRT